MIIRYKAVLSGDVIEIYEYEKPILSGKDAILQSRKEKEAEDTPEWIRDLDSEGTSGKYRDDSLARARKKIRRLINANVYRHPNEDGEIFKPVFMTLTFADNVVDVDPANREFKKFIQRLNHHVYGRGKTGLKYVAAIEFQKRGAVHYHCVFFNLPFIEASVIASLWGQGYIKVNSLKKRDGTNCDNVGAYVTKYMQKELDDERLHGRKCYLVSKGLHQPEEIALDEAALERLRASIDSAKVYEAQFDTEYLGRISYQQYNLTGTDLKPDFSVLAEVAG